MSHRYLYHDYLQNLIDVIRYQKRLIKFNYHLKSLIESKLSQNKQQVREEDGLLKQLLQEYSRSQVQLNQVLDSTGTEEAVDEIAKKMTPKLNRDKKIKDEL